MSDAVSAAPTTEENPEELYERLEQLGRGLIADVYRARVRKTGEEVAIKVIDLGDVDPDSDEFGPIIDEIRGLSKIRCPQLSHYLDAFVLATELWIVLELAPGGSVADIMKSRPSQSLSENEISYILSEALLGLDYLHDRQVPHSGIKASNILVSRGGGVVLSDYGVFEQLQHQMTKRDTFLHSPHWMAPETISQGEEMPFSTQSDVWSLGVTCIEMALGKPPYADLHPMKAIFNIPKCDPARLPADDARFSQEFRDFVALCIQKDPAVRPTVKQLLSHPFLSKKDGGREAIAASVEQTIKSKPSPPPPSDPAPSATAATSPPAIATDTVPAAAASPTPPSADGQHSRKPSSSASTLTAVIYPTLTHLLQQNKDNEQVVASLARLKVAFDNLEKKKPGSVHTFISQAIDSLSHQKK